MLRGRATCSATRNASFPAAWARASAGMAKAGAAYLTIRNIGSTPDRLIAASAPVARRAELHTHIMTDSVMRMRRIKAVPVAAGGAATLKPSGNHVMLMGLHAPLRKDGQFPLTLTFEKAGDVTVRAHAVAFEFYLAPWPEVGGREG